MDTSSPWGYVQARRGGRSSPTDLRGYHNSYDLPIADSAAHGAHTPPTSWFTLASEILPSVSLALLGLILTGTLLDSVQTWPVFKALSSLFILVPTLLGLKGNLEMNLASRLSTVANMGVLDHPTARWSVVFGNLCLLQIQASCVAGISAVWSLFLGGVLSSDSATDNAGNAALLAASAIVTACAASGVLGLAMCLVVIVCRLIDVDPDNIAAPIAASLGDLITLVTLSGTSSLLFSYLNTPINVVLIVFILSCLPFWVFLVLQNEYVREVLNTGWSPLFAAMFISTFGGVIFESFLDKFVGLGLLVPVLNGVCGNLACIYASRLSTMLHQRSSSHIDDDPSGKQKGRHGQRPVPKLDKRDPTPMTLVAINNVVQTTFLLIVRVLGLGGTQVSATFAAVYVISSNLLVVVLLIFTRNLTLLLWRLGLDPDNYVLPLITAVCDMAGSSLIIAGLFLLVNFLGDDEKSKLLVQNKS
ncbi:solute carrier family 41 member 1 [Cladochytrium replicatum]|nr:solute carrier family 41 member 1 [Cladochytrium replicatum]